MHGAVCMYTQVAYLAVSRPVWYLFDNNLPARINMVYGFR